MSYFKQKLKSITTLIFDVDGVFTDNSVILMPDGDLVRSMNIKDGFAVKEAVRQGFNVCVISSGRYQAVRKRLLDLGVKDIYLGVNDKLDTFRDYLLDINENPENCLFMGDDIPDYFPMKESGIAASPSDAVDEIRSIAHYVSPFVGGKGCVRDIIEQTLRAQNKWFNPFS